MFLNQIKLIQRILSVIWNYMGKDCTYGIEFYWGIYGKLNLTVHQILSPRLQVAQAISIGKIISSNRK